MITNSMLIAYTLLEDSRIMTQIHEVMHQAAVTGLGIAQVSLDGIVVLDSLDIYEDSGNYTPVRRRSINHASTRSTPTQTIAETLASIVPSVGRVMQLPAIGDWHVRPQTKINQAPKQAFKSRMRSVNRNR